jgi:hypothetical protein
MTRAQLVTVLWRLEDEPKTTKGKTFKDVPKKEWYSDAVAWASANSIVNGVSKEEPVFDPSGKISREQIATMLQRYANYLSLKKYSRELKEFSDKDQVSDWAGEGLEWAVGAGIIKGMGTIPESINPKGDATRAQVVTMLTRLIPLIVE